VSVINTLKGSFAMPATIEISKRDELITWTLRGRITPPEVHRNMEELRAHPEWSARYNQIFIMEDTDLSALSAAEIDRLILMFADTDDGLTYKSRGRSALVCSDPLAQAILVYCEHKARMLRIQQKQVFRSARNARNWLLQPA
jgi:hypothetical protein